MTIDEVKALAECGESETLEYKASTGTRRKAAWTVCAMLNQRGGVVLFGVTREGKVVGQQVGVHTIEELSAELRRIDPAASPSVSRIHLVDDLEVIAVRVSQGPARPYTYRGTAYRRVGDTTSALSAEDYNQIMVERIHSGQRWENQPAVGWSVNDLDVAEIRRVVAEGVRRGRMDEPPSREPADLLRGLGVLRDGVLLRAAAVLFGNRERLEVDMPQCVLRVARFRGTDKMQFLDNRQFNGNAFTLLANAERFLRDSLPIAARFEEDRFDRIDEPMYPPLATREALANALCHRDYSIGGGSIGVAIYDDRLEITSAGSLHFGLTPEKLFVPHESRPWNPLIARAFHRRGIIEEWGHGTLKMTDLTSAAGLPMLEIEDDGWCVMVRFRHGQFVPEPGGSETNPAQRKQVILSLLNNAGDGMARRDIIARLAPYANQRQVTRDLETLRERGLIASSGHGGSARWKRVRTSDGPLGV